jgi:hypothetical protein
MGWEGAAALSVLLLFVLYLLIKSVNASLESFLNCSSAVESEDKDALGLWEATLCSHITLSSPPSLNTIFASIFFQLYIE